MIDHFIQTLAVGAESSLFVFDCYGTLFDDRTGFPDVATVCDVLSLELGIHETDVQVFANRLIAGAGQSLLGEGPPTSIFDRFEVLADEKGLKVRRDTCEALLWSLLGGGTERFSLAPGAIQLLAAITSAGHKVRLLSNCVLPGSLMDRVLGALGIARFVDMAVYSSDGLAQKPSREAFELVSVGEFTDRWMVGDNQCLDIEPAQRLGWRTFLVEGRLPTAECLGLI
jgi:FMN phosphatase YigB (HAD superfamily)